MFLTKFNSLIFLIVLVFGTPLKSKALNLSPPSGTKFTYECSVSSYKWMESEIWRTSNNKVLNIQKWYNNLTEETPRETEVNQALSWQQAIGLFELWAGARGQSFLEFTQSIPKGLMELKHGEYSIKAKFRLNGKMVQTHIETSISEPTLEQTAWGNLLIVNIYTYFTFYPLNMGGYSFTGKFLLSKRAHSTISVTSFGLPQANYSCRLKDIHFLHKDFSPKISFQNKFPLVSRNLKYSCYGLIDFLAISIHPQQSHSTRMDYKHRFDSGSLTGVELDSLLKVFLLQLQDHKAIYPANLSKYWHPLKQLSSGPLPSLQLTQFPAATSVQNRANTLRASTGMSLFSLALKPISTNHYKWGQISILPIIAFINVQDKALVGQVHYTYSPDLGVLLNVQWQQQAYGAPFFDTYSCQLESLRSNNHINAP